MLDFLKKLFRWCLRRKVRQTFGAVVIIGVIYVAVRACDEGEPPDALMFDESRLLEPGTIIPPDSWPASWFHHPQTASIAGINEFSESPTFAGLVEQGLLPPVEERLPDDPVVVDPYEQPGYYGGTVRTAGWLEWYFNPIEGQMRMCPEGARTRYNLIRELEVSDDMRTYTLHLRPGIKWSDGHPHTVDDYLFWFDHVFMNPDLTPARGAPYYDTTTFRKIDDYTLEVEFENPNAYYDATLAHPSGWPMMLPAHYARDYHPAFTDIDALERRAGRWGFVSWRAYFRSAVLTGVHGQHLFDPPTLRAFRLTGRSMRHFYYEPNPYYWKVDTAGQQLPYVDVHIRSDGVPREMVIAMAATGELTIACTPLRPSDIPFLLRNEKQGGYRTYFWFNFLTAYTMISFNQTHSDPAVREILTDVRFRRALSLAMNRDEINEALFFGLAIPFQTFVTPVSKFYEEEVLRSAYLEFDPEEAKRLLDEMGLKDRTGDGMRNRRDGSNLNIIIETSGRQETMQLILEQWREVGLNFHLRGTPLNIMRQRGESNALQMVAWYADRIGDTLFPNEPRHFVPTVMSGEIPTWGLWARWFMTDGEEGLEPSGEARNLMKWWREMHAHSDRERRIELGRKIMRSQAENLWTIGDIAFAPQPMVVQNRLRNVPERGYWGWDNKMIYPYHAESFFLMPEDKVSAP